MEKKLYIGNVDYQTTKDQLGDAFSEFGEIRDIFIPTDRETGKSRGFAFLTFSEEEDADKAIQAMNGKKFNGRELSVSEARPMNRR